jgi:hypothetical protein
VNTNKQQATETRIVSLKPGMYIVRFNAIPTLGEGAILSIAPSENGVKFDFLASDGVKNNTLFNQSDCIVVRCAGGEGNLLITSLCKSDSRPVGTRIDKITGATDRPGADTGGMALQAQSQARLPQPAAIHLKLLGHVEMSGDVAAHRGDWLGDPKSSRRLEGFAIDWDDRPQELDIASSCVIGGLGRSPAVLSGGFCGSRQRAAPITALTVSLVGKNASAHQLNMEAVFAGCPPQTMHTGVEVRGITGREQLVAIRASVSSKR